MPIAVTIHLKNRKEEIIIIRWPRVALVWPKSFVKKMVESIVGVEIFSICYLNYVQLGIAFSCSDSGKCVGKDSFLLELFPLITLVVHEIFFCLI